MGVQGLWELLAPVGRRVSVETLSGKKLAIDASIWMVQFMKAMRDERGEMIRNAHILGFFRRICKLLFLRTKPVFVFDGGTPAIKRRTVAARRRHRENARAKIRKTAEKLLLNHLKSKRLEELTDEIKRSKLDVKADLKGKQVSNMDEDGALNLGDSSQGLNKAINQETLDGMLAASIAAEEEGQLVGNEPALTENAWEEEEEEDGDDEDKEIIFPVNSGNIDPTVLASLPPSMQLDLLHQMRENLMADNRQKYQKIKKVPAKFSELQIESYLKTIAFRREIVEVQKNASGRGVGGLQTSRIASDANREYIFSSSFTGDKQMLASTGSEKNDAFVSQEMRRETSSNVFKQKFFISSSKIPDNKNSDGTVNDSSLDERGRVRGPGIHMTRDLQRNLDLMKEQEKALLKGHSQTETSSIISLAGGKNGILNSMSIGDEEINHEISRTDEKSAEDSVNEAAIEITFSEDEIGSKSMVDNLFMNLVSGNSTVELFSERKETNFDDSESECIWEDGTLGEQSLSINGDDHHENQSSFMKDNDGEEEDEDMWEKGASFVSHLKESEKEVSVGFRQEEADLDEAIRRSLEDIKSKNGKATAVDDRKSLTSANNDIDIKFRLERTQLHHAVIDSHENKDEKNSSACSVVGLSKDLLLEKHSTNQLSQEILFSKLMGEEETLGKNDDFLSENHSIAALDIGLSRTRLTEKMPAILNEHQEFGNDADKDFSEGLSFSSQASIQDEDNFAFSEDNLRTEISRLNEENTNLGVQQRKLERNAESVSSEMFTECQELLQMFGLPYIIAPMEAEAQCAFMEMTKFVDGIVTDDSDVFLFGARNVYKNIFDDRKYVETYFMKDIENELGLSRDNLIHMALLLGSDYTEGVSGIGIVNAIEVINAFPEKVGLHNFKEWVESPDLAIFGSRVSHRDTKSGDTTDKMDTKESLIKGDESSESAISIAKIKDIFMEKHRNVSKNWHFPPSFPSESVISAYISPQIDSSTEPFLWGKPDLSLLRKICWEKFGWPNQKADELLLPVLKEYNKHETQLRMEAFYSFNERFAKIRSQRIKKAVKGIAGNNSSMITENDADNSTVDETKSSKKSKMKDVRGRVANGRAKGKGKAKEKRKEDGHYLNENLTESFEGENRRSEKVNVSGMAAESTSGVHIRKSSRRRKYVNYAEDDKEIGALPDLDITVGEAAFDLNEVALKAGTFDKDEKNSGENPMPGDYVHSGGGFCQEEDGDNCNYLISGGGICNYPKDLEVVAQSLLSAMPSLKRRRRK